MNRYFTEEEAHMGENCAKVVSHECEQGITNQYKNEVPFHTHFIGESEKSDDSKCWGRSGLL